MRYDRRVISAFPVILSAMLAAGCGRAGTMNETKNQHTADAAMESTPIVDYAVPQLYPNVMVDKRGYAGAEEKVAAVKGRDLPRDFRILEASTGRIVYTGALEDVVSHEELGIYSGYADFSDFCEEGVYYLECDGVGRSFRFQVEDALYASMFRDVYEELTESCRSRELTLQEAVLFLTAYEWYGDLFPDEDDDKVPDVLKELKGWVAHVEEQGVSGSEEALYGAMLAKFSYLYQKYDRGYANECLKRASTVFGQVQKKATFSADAESFFALTELYRATGLDGYRKQIEDYEDFFEDNSGYLKETGYLYAVMTYIATRQKVNVGMCESFTERLMSQAEEISDRYVEMLHPVTAKNNGLEELMQCAVEVSCANYVMNNYQYTRVTQEFLHYLMGRNLNSADLCADGENRAELLLLLASLASGRQ